MTPTGPPLPTINGPDDFQAAFDVSRETLARLELYADLLQQWQATINLVAPSTLGQVWHRHFADSAQLLTLAPSTARTWLDIGSGGGFPGLVIAILLAEAEQKSPVPSATLVESDARKAAFLREVARQTAVPVDILNVRIENAATQSRVGADVITARAVAPLARLLPLIKPFFSVKSKALLLKGQKFESEIRDAQQAWRFDCQVVDSLTDRDGRIVMISDLQPKSEG